jgi:Phospholipase_D-nuclease N-terminal
MLLSGALFALFMTGFWLYCLTDAIFTPASECRGVSKPAWIVIIAVTFIGGAIAWLIVRQPTRSSSGPFEPMPYVDQDGSSDSADGHFRTGRWTDADDAVARHPAGRARMAEVGRSTPKGPDDDPEFLRALARTIRGNSQAGEELLASVAPGISSAGIS